MLLYFVTCFSFILFYRFSLPIKPLPSWASEMRLLSFHFWKDLSILLPSVKSLKSTLFMNFNSNNKKIVSSDNHESTTAAGPSLLDLPELALESILEKLEPAGLCKMACVSTYLREMCLSDHLWKDHLNQRWGRIIGSAAHREWQLQIASQKQPKSYFLEGGKRKGLLWGYLSKLWPVMMVRAIFNGDASNEEGKQIKSFNDGSIVSFYRSLEMGNFWFPAQVFNRENGHVGFVLSCYDAELRYDSLTDTFEARYPPHGRRAVATESGVTWDRIRAAPVDTSPYDLHISECLKDLSPGDQFEIQWRRNKQFPYGWWYGVVAHLETCDGNDTYCRCRESNIVVLEFRQYVPGSRWRHTKIDRNYHREEGNEAEGFYGGIRKLYNTVDMSMWKQFWPAEILE